MTQTVAQPAPGTPQADPLFLPAVRSFAAQGITPARVLSWDPSGEDRSVSALASALQDYLSRAAVKGSAEDWEIRFGRACIAGGVPL